jgi:DNA helicase-4
MNAYDQHLRANGEIDFNDMITMATEYVAQGRFQNPYRFVIVDEYQDISKARFRLLKTLRESQDYDLFCVGDDWQSIYRFAGSDIGFILNFSQYWGASEESKIETTYRFTQSLIEISGNFIMKNPAQKKKAIRGQGGDSSFALSEVNGYTEKYALEFMAQKLEDLPKDSTVFFLGRYSFDSNMLKDSGLFALQYNNQTGFLDVRYQKRPDLKMCFITAHKSKGLQADYVVILNNKGTRMGFPSMIQDSPILDLLLEKADNYPHSEERRLFYVALTRAKKKAILLTIKDKESVFAKELKECYGEDLKKENFTCPLCGGKLIRRTGKFGDFFGCSNYTTGQCKYTRNIRWNKQE